VNKAHVAIFSVAHPVLVNPTLTLVATLTRRGYRTTYVTSQRFAAEVSRLGADVLLMPRTEPPFTQDKGLTLPMDRQYSSGDLLDLTPRTLEAVWPYFLQNKPDIILYDAIAIAGLIVAERLGIPSIRMSPQFALDEKALELPIIRPDIRQSVIEVRSRLTQYLRSLGVPRDDDVRFDRAVPTIYFFPREFQLNGQTDGHCIYAGRCAAERPLIGTWRPPAVSRPLILLSTSTIYVKGIEYYRTCLQALTDLNWHCLLATGRYVDVAGLMPLPPHCEIVEDIPQLLLMPHVEMILCLGGMATTMESMYHGLPMLMMSNGYSEAEMYADNVQHLGLGIHLQSEATTTEDIRRSIIQISEDEALRERVNMMQKRVKRGLGGEEVINWVEDFLETPQRHFFASI
jgi:MGT family glycosyltransferase